MSSRTPPWFLHYANSNVLFVGIPTGFIVLLWVCTRLLTRRIAGHARWTDLDFGLELVMAAVVALPLATALRVGKEFHGEGTPPRSTIEISGVMLVALVVLAVTLARAAGRRRSRPRADAPTVADLVFAVFVPNLAGIFAMMFVLLFAARGGTLHA